MMNSAGVTEKCICRCHPIRGCPILPAKMDDFGIFRWEKMLKCMYFSICLFQPRRGDSLVEMVLQCTEKPR